MPWFLISGNTFSKTHCTRQRTLKGYWWLSYAYQWPHFPHPFSFCLLGYQRAWLQGYEMFLLPQRLIRDPEFVLWVSFLFRPLSGCLEPWGLTFLRATGILFVYNTNTLLINVLLPTIHFNAPLEFHICHLSLNVRSVFLNVGLWASLTGYSLVDFSINLWILSPSVPPSLPPPLHVPTLVRQHQ